MGRENLTVMVVDGSARAHALAAAYMASPNVRKVVVVPGNDLIVYNPIKEVVLVKGASVKSVDSIVAAAEAHRPDLIDVAQDDALALGAVDRLKGEGFKVLGPTQAAARIEWDKAFARNFMEETGIPHPLYSVFSDSQRGIEFVETIYRDDPGTLIFVKASGLCAGKGAIPARSLEEAKAAIEAMARFGDAGRTYLIERGMVGVEASVYAFSDGSNFKMVRSAQDFKRRDAGDLGPNTGGMGSVAPTQVVSPNLMRGIESTIMKPALSRLSADGTPYVGVLYGGMMIVEEFCPGGILLGGALIDPSTNTIEPKVVEFNARWGAPEAEVIVPGIETPMDEIAAVCIDGKLADLEIKEDNQVRVCIVGASRGYPDDYRAVRGKEIFGLGDAMRLPHVTVFGAGVKVEGNRFYADGGRLFSLVAKGRDVQQARERALEVMARVHIEGNGLHYRTDIGHHDLERHYKG